MCPAAAAFRAELKLLRKRPKRSGGMGGDVWYPVSDRARGRRGCSGKGEDVLNQLLGAAAVLALFTGTIAVAQTGGGAAGSVGGTVGMTVDGTVGGPINRSFTGDAGERSGGGSGGRTMSHTSASSWAPTAKAANGEKSAAKPSSGREQAGAAEQASSGK